MIGDVWQRAYTQVATDAFSQELKEFWPDIRRHLKHHDNGVSVADSNSQH